MSFWCLQFLPKNEQINLTLLLWYLMLTCFRSFFGKNWCHQKDISKLTDLWQFLDSVVVSTHVQEKSSFGVNFCGLLDEFLVNVCGHLIVRKRVTLYQAITKSNPNCNHLMIFFGWGCEFWRHFRKIEKFPLSYSALLSGNCHLLERCKYPSAKS